eukprot:CAMPEP_0174844522 /NCGR_PEP_ID=MMETSP1114-20130205/11144_1 /TAXON_ID=312471 /ORGANISM="Neobodo designis, Strain CCAP 1951/1" /LENGTH=566 /DNA_ID=CAMNT_0016078759 /DNA_START=38 /DNA_END=1734 /DNA_ORIENTATION=+
MQASRIPWPQVITLVVALAALAVALFTSASLSPTKVLPGGLAWRQVLTIAAVVSVSLAVLITFGLIAHIASLHRVAVEDAVANVIAADVKHRSGPAADDTSATGLDTVVNESVTEVQWTSDALRQCPFCRSKRVWETRYMARLMLLVPLYAAVVLPALLVPRVETAAVADQVKNTVEAFVAYTFWSLMVLYGGGYARLMLDWPRYFLLEGESLNDITHGRHVGLLQSPGRSTAPVSARDADWTIGCRWCRDGESPPTVPPPKHDDAAAHKLLTKAFWSLRVRRWMARRTLAVVIGRWLAVLYLVGNLLMLPIVITCGCVSSVTGGWIWADRGGTVDQPHRPMYLPGDADFKAAMYPYVFQARCMLLTPSLVVIIWGIGTLSRTVMHTAKALPSKFVTVKAVVFLGVWQQLSIALCRRVGALTHFDDVSLAHPTWFPRVAESSTHYGVALTELLIDGVLCSFEMLPIAIVSCFVFNASTLSWSIRRCAQPAVDGQRSSMQPQSPATPLQSSGESVPLVPASPSPRSDADEAFVRRNLGGASLWYLGDVVRDVVEVWSWRYELPAARG